MKHENVREFADFILNKNMDIDTDDSFDNKEMGEYARTRKGENMEHKLALGQHFKASFSSDLRLWVSSVIAAVND